MRHIIRPSLGCSALALLIFGSSDVRVVAQSTDPEEITLDPVCESIDSRNPTLPQGHPAPSTRRMAELLAQFYEKASRNRQPT